MDDTLCRSYRDVVDTKLDKLRVEIKSNKELLDERARFGDKALELAREGLNKRMEAENRIREELREQTTTFISRAEYKAFERVIDERMLALIKDTSKLDGRMVAICFIIPIIVTILMMSISQMVKP